MLEALRVARSREILSILLRIVNLVRPSVSLSLFCFLFSYGEWEGMALTRVGVVDRWGGRANAREDCCTSPHPSLPPFARLSFVTDPLLSPCASFPLEQLVGGCPVVMAFSSKRYSREIRLEAALFIGSMCRTSLLTVRSSLPFFSSSS